MSVSKGFFQSGGESIEDMRRFDARQAWDKSIQAERDHQRELGYDEAHDDEHGVDHLLRWAQEYIRVSKGVEAAALIEAAREKMLRDQTAFLDDTCTNCRGGSSSDHPCSACNNTGHIRTDVQP